MESSNLGNVALNGTFLMLNLESNTLGLGNSFTFPPSHEAYHANLRKKPRNLDNCGRGLENDTGSTSTNETCTSSQQREHRRPSKESVDPDWTPKERAGSSRSSGINAAKSNTGQLIRENRSEILSGKHNVTFITGLVSPPQYLVDLLNLFGWKVVLQPGFGDYIYVSPAGLAYYSFPKAFETFLHGTSKYKRPWSLSQIPESKGKNSTSGRGSPSSNQVLQSGTANEGTLKKGRGTTIKNPTLDKNAKTGKKSPQQEGSSYYENHKKTSNKPRKKISQAVNRVKPSSEVHEKSITLMKGTNMVNKPNQITHGDVAARGSVQSDKTGMENVKFLGLRRSARLSSRDICGGIEVNISKTNEESLNFSPARSGGNVGNDKGKRQTSTSQGKITLEVSEPSMITVPDNIRKSNSTRNNVRIGKSNNNIYEDYKMARAMETRHVNQENILAGANMFAQGMVRNSLTMPNSSSSTVVANTWYYSADVHGIKRSTFINGKHVCVDDKQLTKEGCCDMLHFAASGVVKEKQKLEISFSGVDSVEGRNSGSNDILVKQTDIVKSTNGHLVNHHPIKAENSKRERSESSSCLAEIEVEISVADRCSKFSAAKMKLTSGGTSNLKGTKGRRHSLIVRRKLNDDCYIASQAKLTILSWLIDSGIICENEKAVFISKNSSEIPTGMVSRGGIRCDCCKELMTLSRFAAHSGSNVCRPWNDIYLMSGKTFIQCLQESCIKEKEQHKVGFQAVETDDPDPSDDTCGICADGGKLICCDGCPSTFHQECVLLEDLPEGNWYCGYCRCTFCMMTEHASDIGSEVSTLFTCKQCRRKYHLRCAQGDSHEMGSLLYFFCGDNCQKLSARLSDLVGVCTQMEGGFSWTLLKLFNEEETITSNERLSFALECNVKLSMALFVLNECFIPLTDHRTGHDIISQAVYSCGSKFHRLNYEGFYTFILEKDEEVISVASLRFLGKNLVEMPFVGTRPLYRKQGMCCLILQAMQDMLSSLSIKKLIIPAIRDLLETWMSSFSFKHIDSSLKDEIRNISMVTFPETTLLEKSIGISGTADDERLNKSRASQVEGFQVSLERHNSLNEHCGRGLHGR